MSKFHISKDGIARPCTAKGPCPLGGDEVHFTTKEEAQDYIDSVNEEEYGILAPSQQVDDNIAIRYQNRIDKLEKEREEANVLYEIAR